MSKRKPKSEHKKNGRPTVMTEIVLRKLEDAFMNGFTDSMASLYAGISERTLYEYCEVNPDFAQRKETLKETPNLRAQQTLVADLKNTGGARWWAEKRMPEFMPQTKITLGGKIETSDTSVTDAVRTVTHEYEEKLRDAIKNKIKARV